VSAFDPLGLAGDRRAAVGSCDSQALPLRDRPDRVGDLGRKLAGRNEDQHGGGAVLRRDPLDDRHAESKRLAGSGRRLREHVGAAESGWDDERLDRKRLIDTVGGKRFDGVRAHAERGKRLV